MTNDAQMKLLVLADLHREFWPGLRVKPELPREFSTPDLTVLAGDLCHATPGWGEALPSLRRDLGPEIPLLAFPGNHEYYLGQLDDAPLSAACEASGVSFGQKRVTLLGATRLLTCTLWTDGLLFGEVERPATMRAVQKALNDYRLIRAPGTDRAITPQETVSIHEDHLAWLRAELAKPHDGPTVVITHHCPHPDASLPVDAVTAGFVSDLSALIEEHQPDAWVFGHTHRPQSATLGRTRIHNVGLGYPAETARFGLREMLLRGCVTVGDEVRFLMDEDSPRPVLVITPSEGGPEA